MIAFPFPTECVLWACASMLWHLCICNRLGEFECVAFLSRYPRAFLAVCVPWFLMYNCWCRTCAVPHLLDLSAWQLSSISLIVRLLWLMKTIHFITSVHCWKKKRSRILNKYSSNLDSFLVYIIVGIEEGQRNWQFHASENLLFGKKYKYKGGRFLERGCKGSNRSQVWWPPYARQNGWAVGPDEQGQVVIG